MGAVSTGLLPFLPAELARDTVEALRQEQSGITLRLYALLIAGGLSTLAALPLVKVDRYVLAPGLIQPAADRASLRAAASGTIKELLVRENEPVKAGQPILRLDTSDLDQRLIHVRANRNEHALVASDLSALADHIISLERRDPTLGWRESIEDFAFSGMHPLKSPTILSEFRHLMAQLQSRVLETQKANAELTRVGMLARSGVLAPVEVETAAFETHRLNMGIELMLQQARAQWLTQLREEQASIMALRDEEHALNEAKRLRTVTAPIDGVVLGISALARDTFVTSGQEVGVISPTGELIVQAYVEPRDIVRLYPGQRALIEAESFPAAAGSTVSGTVIAISDDRVASPLSTNHGFRVTLQLDATSPGTSAGRLVNLRKGLAVGVRLVVGRESLLRVLLNRSAEWISPFGRG